MDVNAFLSKTYFGNRVESYIISLAIFLGFVSILRIIAGLISNKFDQISDKTTNNFDNAISDIFDNLGFFFYSATGLYFSSKYISLPHLASRGILVYLLISLTYEAVLASGILIDYFLNSHIKKNEHGAPGTYGTLTTIIKAVMWVIGALFVLQNIGVNITTLLAGVGIGGIAIGIALQNILSDLFSSFAILIDKPFEIGDFIIVGDKMGTVEKIGIKTTRAERFKENN